MLEDKFWYDVPYYDFSIDAIQCNTTRSRNKDTLHMAISVAVGNRDPLKASKSLGEHEEGTFNPGLIISGVPVGDNEIPFFSYVLVNDGHSDDGVVLKTLEGASSKIAHAGASAAADAVKTASSAAAGDAIGAVVGTS